MEIIQTFFLRVSARCNLDCNYCYVFKHNDSSWKNLPPIMSRSTLILFAERLNEYVLERNITKVYIIFHGGEPLLIGSAVIIAYIDIITNALNGSVNLEFSLQTNGVLLSEKFLFEAEKRKVGISLSIDGPQIIHNKNRKMRNGLGSFEKVMVGIKKLKKYPNLFHGVIGVVDPYSDPNEIFDFFMANEIYNIDLLLPDANYSRPPIYRDSDSDIYLTWLIKSFDIWFNYYQEISFRTYENILKKIMGIEASSDSFGFGQLNYLTIESDGSYHTSDILKVAYENASNIGISLTTDTIYEAVSHMKVVEYNSLLKRENLPMKCVNCGVSKICGGGSLPHRYSVNNNFNNPTIYCNEMMALISHAIDKLSSQLGN